MIDITLGKEIFLSPLGNAVYYHGKQKLLKGIVTKIGRKYFYVSLNGTVENPDSRPLRFSIDNQKHTGEDCNAGYNLYNTAEEYYRIVEYTRMKATVSRRFRDGRHIPDNLMRQIYNILLNSGQIEPIQDPRKE